MENSREGVQTSHGEMLARDRDYRLDTDRVSERRVLRRLVPLQTTLLSPSPVERKKSFLLLWP
jgi:hypothetical protein